jgi:hypothetical protein
MQIPKKVDLTDIWIAMIQQQGREAHRKNLPIV